ncbi:thiamine pyrophosphate-binding protein [Kitasatospora sp. NPDC058965]|uniref:thiamine pyrophosphate-binding protein n=1 Tax=Kitasatospora sp. NPDC058965 TaxID=3346682 RepID=UPI003699D21C
MNPLPPAATHPQPNRPTEPVPPAEAILTALREAGHTHYTGVPCSLLKGLFARLENDGRHHYLPAPREDSALGTAVGLLAAGAKPVVLMQNSGLGYSLNVLTSLCLIYDLHVPLIVSWRGRPGTGDAVEHDVIGRELTHLLDLFDLPWTVLDPAEPTRSVAEFLARGEDGRRTTVLIVKEAV